MLQRNTYNQSIQPGGHVVEDDAPAIGERFELADRKRLGDIKKPEEDECEQTMLPVGRAEERG